MISKNVRILITGGAGFLGSFVVKKLKQKGYSRLVIPRSRDYDLRNRDACRKITKDIDYVIHLAANVGGIGYNQMYPATLFYDNALMGIHMINESMNNGVKKFVQVGTVCAYPKYTPLPFSEDSLWQGYPEETNAPYGLAKKMLLVAAQAYRKQYGFNVIYLLPVNLYGPGDNMNPHSSHVIPALIRKMYLAVNNKEPEVVVWGTGTVSREFLYVEDAAEGLIAALLKYNKPDPVNLGAGSEITIAELIKKIAEIYRYRGKIIWDKTKPDGQPRRLLSTERALVEFGFKAKIPLDIGLKKTIRWYNKLNEK